MPEPIADLRPRVIAHLVDVGIVVAVLSPIAWLNLYGGRPDRLLLPFAALHALYFVTCWAVSSGTPGMSLNGVRIARDPGGSRIGFLRALVRYIGLVVSIVAVGAGLLAAFRDSRHRGWHDALSRTVVVATGRRGRPGWVAAGVALVVGVELLALAPAILLSLAMMATAPRELPPDAGACALLPPSALAEHFTGAVPGPSRALALDGDQQCKWGDNSNPALLIQVRHPEGLASHWRNTRDNFCRVTTCTSVDVGQEAYVRTPPRGTEVWVLLDDRMVWLLAPGLTPDAAVELARAAVGNLPPSR